MTEPRTLRKKRDRALLYLAQDGKCAKCGAPLPDDWHADHIVPWKDTHRTNIHEMQALCPVCNLTKGGRMETRLRKHQKELRDVAIEIAAGAPITDVIVSVTPGGGKSFLPVILAQELIPRFADAICWIVPRCNLQLQGEKSFKDAIGMGIVDHKCEIRISTNDPNPSRNLSGHITTYQAVDQGWSVLAQEFKRKRYILFLDEPHHIAYDSGWAAHLQPLVDYAVLRVYASGTLERHDRKPIAFLPYRNVAGGQEVDLGVVDSRRVIYYSRRDALRENAIIELVFRQFDGATEFVDAEGQRQSIGTLENAETSRDALFTALNTDFVYQLLETCVDEWQQHRKYTYPTSKLLVVAPSIYLAKEYTSWLNKHGIDALIATSEESEEAQRNIGRFRGDREFIGRDKEIDALVTVGMAYEGLDCKDITHIACLTYVRSKPWLEQCFARANRVASGKKQAFIYGPSDALFNSVMQQIKDDQHAIAKELREPKDSGDGGDGHGQQGEIIPLYGEVQRQRTLDLDGDEMTYEQTQRALTVMDKYGISGDPLMLKKAMAELGMTLPYMEDQRPPVHGDTSKLSPSQREARIRSDIERYVRRAAWAHGLKPYEINYALVASFKKNREEMTESELGNVWAYLQRMYPIDEHQDLYS